MTRRAQFWQRTRKFGLERLLEKIKLNLVQRFENVRRHNRLFVRIERYFIRAILFSALANVSAQSIHFL